MRILHLTTLILSGALGSIMGIFISPTSGFDSSVAEGLLLGVSVGLTVGVMIMLPQFGFMQKGIRQMLGEKFSKKNLSFFKKL